LLAASLGVIRVLEREAGFDIARQADYVAGHSLGEYSALAAAGALPVAEAARLVKRRGQAMQKAVPVGEGAMAALLGLDIEAAHVPLFANAAAAAVSDPEEIKSLLVEQTTRMVRWRESVLLFAANEVEELVEIGAGRVLAGLVKRIDRKLSALSVGTPGEI